MSRFKSLREENLLAFRTSMPDKAVNHQRYRLLHDCDDRCSRPPIVTKKGSSSGSGATFSGGGVPASGSMGVPGWTAVVATDSDSW